MSREQTQQTDRDSSSPFLGSRDPGITLAASVGGLQVISTGLAILPLRFLAAIVADQPISSQYRSQMAEILTCPTALDVQPDVQPVDEGAKGGGRSVTGEDLCPKTRLLLNSLGCRGRRSP